MDIGAVIIAALGGILIYVVFSAISRFSNGTKSKSFITWDEIITEESSEFEKSAYEKLFKPNNIDANKFTAAMLYFMGKPVDNSMITDCMDYWGNGKSEFDKRFDLIYYSAFPDVIRWALSNDLKNFFNSEIRFNEEGIITVESFKELVNQFKNKTDKSFEMASD